MKKTTTLNVVITSLILVGFGVLLYVYYKYSQGEDFESYSKFGDGMGGVVGTLWSLAGIFLFYLALTEQRKDIKINQKALNSQIKSLDIQIEEYRLQRIELEETKRVLRDQSEAFKIQQFESTFFNMLRLLQDIINDLEITVEDNSSTGRDFFKAAFYSLKNSWNQNNNLTSDPNQTIKKQDFIQLLMSKNPHGSINDSSIKEFKLKTIEVYEDFYSHYHYSLGHYFRFVYNIMKFTINSKLTEDKRYQYINLIQAQMSSYELSLIFYNALSKHGNRMFVWLEQYGFLENIDNKALLSPIHWKFYPETKFKFIEMMHNEP